MAEEDEDSAKLEFDDQCFLMDYAHLIAPANKACSKNYDFVLLETEPDSGPAEIIATLRGAIGPDGNGLQEFLDITPHQIGLLQPKVRLFKISYAHENDEGTEVELMFNDFTSPTRIEAITESNAGRGGGAGLKEFTWEYDGTNPAEATKSIAVDLKMHFQTVLDLTGMKDDVVMMDDMTDVRLAEPGNPSFLDLILLPPGRASAISPATGGKGYVPQFYKIKAVVGWNVPPGDSFSEALKRELKSMHLIMYLNLVTHEIEIKEDGSIDLSASYRASMETSMDSKSTDVLVAAPSLGIKFGIMGPMPTVSDADSEISAAEAEAAEVEANIADAEAAYACALQTGDEDAASEINGAMIDLKEELQEMKEDIADMKEDNREDIYETFIEDLTDYLQVLDLDGDFIEDWCESGNSREAPALDATIEDAGGIFFDGDPESEDPKDPDKDRINFWFMGDIIQVATEAMRQNPSAPANMNLIMGPMSYQSARNGIQRQINIADIPVSSAMVMEWWKAEVVEKQRDSFPLNSFITSILTRVVVPALKPGCFPKADPVNADVSKTAITLPALFGAAPLEGGRTTLAEVAEKFTDLEVLEETDTPDYEYMFYYIQSTGNSMTGDPEEDRPKGIYHYDIGRDTGLIKKISFKKADTPGLKEARQADLGGLSQLREVYNCDISMVGNNLYIPGMRVYVNPPYGLGNPSQTNTAANLLGLGGYFDIVKISSTISRGGQYTTDLEGIFAGSGAPVRDNGDCEALMESVRATDWYEETQGWLEGIINAIDDAFDKLWGPEIDVDC